MITLENLTRRERERRIRESEIIDAAEAVFCEKGYDNASMDEIAKKAEFTKRTLYQYFINKEDLYFAVALKGFKKLFSYLKEGLDSKNNGFERIKLSCDAYNRFYNDFPEVFRLINYIGYVKKESIDKSERRKELIDFNNSIFTEVSKVIEEGKTDGSIRSGLDSVKVTSSLVFMITGLFSLLSTSGDTFTENFSIDINEFSFFSMELLLNSIKNNK